jgi:hypothetical protein
MTKAAKKKASRGPKRATKLDCVTRSLTTEQLAMKVARDIQRMTEQEKAKVREHLNLAFGPTTKPTSKPN